jgi:hypothetical protein
MGDRLSEHTIDHGAFTQHRIGAGAWTEDDEQRLRGPSPHVLCRGKEFHIGAHVFEPGGTSCFACKAKKVSPRHTDGRGFCFGCGALQ